MRPFVPVWLQGEGEFGGLARGYETQLEEVYRRNPVGLRAVRLVAGMVGGLPLFGAEPALKLVGADGLLERIAAALLLHGNAYVQLIADGHDRPAELNLLRPERVSVATDEAGWPVAYVYRAGGKAVRIAGRDALERCQVAHLKALNPAHDDLLRSGSGLSDRADERIHRQWRRACRTDRVAGRFDGGNGEAIGRAGVGPPLASSGPIVRKPSADANGFETR
jgi:hypothetical protein